MEGCAETMTTDNIIGYTLFALLIVVPLAFGVYAVICEIRGNPADDRYTGGYGDGGFPW